MLMSWADSFGSVAVRPGYTPGTDSGCLDFRQFKESFEAHPDDAFSIEIAWRNFHRSAYEDYEFFRCLGLLEDVADSSERVAGYLNLSHYSAYDRIRPEHARERYTALLKNAGFLRRDRRRIMKSVRQREAG